MDFVAARTALARTIRLGLDVEADDPSLAVPTLSDAEVEWLAAWLVGEGCGLDCERIYA